MKLGRTAAVVVALILATVALNLLSGVSTSDAQGAGDVWAFEESFDGDPAAPSQALLPASMDYVVTHRTGRHDHTTVDDTPYPADHGSDCAGPPSQHQTTSSHLTSGSSPDASFYVCKNHMMTSLGHVSAYSMNAFYARQEFDFADGGVLEFDVNMTSNHSRVWWEVMIVPRDSLKLGSAIEWLPIDETYPEESIVLKFTPSEKRHMMVHTGALPPEGRIAESTDWRNWHWINRDVLGDDDFTDRRRRFTHRVELDADAIHWSIETIDGTFDDYTLDVPGGLPFERGLVLFKTHSYTPEKDDNFDAYTFHWDNIRFDGPVVGRFDMFESNQLLNLQTNSVGDSGVMQIELPAGASLTHDPVLVGQINAPMTGQVLASINGNPTRVVHPINYADGSDCRASGWSTFHLPLDPAHIHVGTNTIEWTVGERPPCADVYQYLNDGYSVKSLEIQLNVDPGEGPPPSGTCQGQDVTIDMTIAGTTGMGTAGDDVIVGTPESDVIDGRGGNDTICAGDGDDRIVGGDGNDIIDGGQGDDTVWAGFGDDTVFGGPGIDRIRGGAGDDELHGGADRDVILGQAGLDTIFGDGGRDSLFGGDDADVIDGGEETDVIRGGGGGDRLLTGPSGNDRLVGGDGGDRLNASSTTGSTRLSGGPGDDTLVGSEQLDRMWGDAGDDVLRGQGFNDLMRGGDGADEMAGGAGRDILEGGPGNDRLDGGPGNGDVLVGSDGNDNCDGGEGTGDRANATCERISGVP